MAVQPTIKKTKGKKKPQAGALKQTKTGSMMKPKLAVGKATGVAKAKKGMAKKGKPLMGAQRNLDANKNNRIDAADFAMLRNQKKRTKKRTGMAKPMKRMG